MSKVRFLGDDIYTSSVVDDDGSISITTNVGGNATPLKLKELGTGISVELPISADELLVKVSSFLESEESRAKLFDALRSYHESRKIKKLVRELKILLNTEKKYPLLKEIRVLIPVEHVAIYDKLTKVSKYGERLIRVERTGNEPMGFTFRGGKEHGIGFYVTSVTDGSAAHLAGLKVSDQIRKINGLPLHESIHDEVACILRNKISVTLLVKNLGKIPSKINNQIIWSEISNEAEPVIPSHVAEYNERQEKRDLLLAFKVGKGGLGCSIRSGIKGHPGMYVVAIQTDSLAERVGLQIGDQILDTNGKDFVYITHEEAVEFLRDKSQLTMIVRHNKDVKKIIEDLNKVEEIPIVEEPIIKRTRFAEEIQVEYLEYMDPYEEEEEVVVLPSQSNFDYPEAILQGREVHYVSIAKKGAFAFDIEERNEKIVVKSIVRGGAVSDHGFIRPGDWLLNVEGTDLIGVSEKKAKTTIVEAFSCWSGTGIDIYDKFENFELPSSKHKYIDFIVACPSGRVPCRLPLKKETSQTVKDTSYFVSAKLINQQRKSSLGGVRSTVQSFELKNDVIQKARSAPKRKDSLDKIQLPHAETSPVLHIGSSPNMRNKVFSMFTSAAPKKQPNNINNSQTKNLDNRKKQTTGNKNPPKVASKSYRANDTNIKVGSTDERTLVVESNDEIELSENISNDLYASVEKVSNNIEVIHDTSDQYQYIQSRIRSLTNDGDDDEQDNNSGKQALGYKQPLGGKQPLRKSSFNGSKKQGALVENIVSDNILNVEQNLSRRHSYGSIGYLTKEFEPSIRVSTTIVNQTRDADYVKKDAELNVLDTEADESLRSSFSKQQPARIHRQTGRASVLNTSFFEGDNVVKASSSNGESSEATTQPSPNMGDQPQYETVGNIITKKSLYEQAAMEKFVSQSSPMEKSSHDEKPGPMDSSQDQQHATTDNIKRRDQKNEDRNIKLYSPNLFYVPDGQDDILSDGNLSRSAEDIWSDSQQRFEDSEENNLTSAQVTEVQSVKNSYGKNFKENAAITDQDETSRRRSLIMTQSGVEVPAQVHMAKVLTPAVSNYRRKTIQEQQEEYGRPRSVSLALADKFIPVDVAKTENEGPSLTTETRSSSDGMLSTGRLKQLKESFESVTEKERQQLKSSDNKTSYTLTVAKTSNWGNSINGHLKPSFTADHLIAPGSSTNVYLPSPYKRPRPVHDLISSTTTVNENSVKPNDNASYKREGYISPDDNERWSPKKALSHEEIMNIGNQSSLKDLVTSFEHQTDQHPLSYPTSRRTEIQTSSSRSLSFPATLSQNKSHEKSPAISSYSDLEVKSILTKGRKCSPKKVQFSNFVTFSTAGTNIKHPVHNPLYNDTEEENEGRILLENLNGIDSKNDINNIVDYINNSTTDIIHDSNTYQSLTPINNDVNQANKSESSDYFINADIYRTSPLKITGNPDNDSARARKSNGKGFLQKAKNKLTPRYGKKQAADQNFDVVPLQSYATDRVGFAKTVTQPPSSFNFIGQSSSRLNESVGILSAEKSSNLKYSTNDARDNRIRKRQAGNVADIDVDIKVM